MFSMVLMCCLSSIWKHRRSSRTYKIDDQSYSRWKPSAWLNVWLWVAMPLIFQGLPLHAQAPAVDGLWFKCHRILEFHQDKELKTLERKTWFHCDGKPVVSSKFIYLKQPTQIPNQNASHALYTNKSLTFWTNDISSKWNSLLLQF